MKKNMGSIDRLIRVLAAIAVIVLFFNRTITGTLGYVLLAIAGIFLLTSVAGLCPLYSVFHIRSSRAAKPVSK
jgi:Na+/phosphate symporter